jgi:hypothetical protein
MSTAHVEVFPMNRAIVLSLILGAVPFAAGCEKSGSDAQSQANEAQDKANKEIGRANAQANEAQRKADEQIAGAQADFVKTREDYRHKVQTDLDSLDKDIAALDAKARTDTAKAKGGLSARLPAIHAQRDSFVNDFRSLESASAMTFDAAKDRLDKEWSSLKAAVDAAR